MPNRILRDWTDSERMNQISFQSEILFLRLMMKADDYGSYHANPKLINAFCYPLKNIRETDISRWLQELVSSGLIALYDAENKPYLHILNFGQRLRTMNSKFPQISENELNKNLTVICQQYAVKCPPETEVETKRNEGKRKEFSPPTLDEVISFFDEKGFSKESAVRAWSYYEALTDENNQWRDKDLNIIKSWKAKMISVWMKPENKKQTEQINPKRKML